jgi:hypothetical protein
MWGLLGGEAPCRKIGNFKAEDLFIGWVGKYRKINSFRIIIQSNKSLLCPINNFK